MYGADGRVVKKERGACSLTPEAFVYHSATEDFEIPTAELSALPFSCGKEFEGDAGVGALSPCPDCGEVLGHSVLSGKELRVTWIEGN